MSYKNPLRKNAGSQRESPSSHLNQQNKTITVKGYQTYRLTSRGTVDLIGGRHDGKMHAIFQFLKTLHKKWKKKSNGSRMTMADVGCSNGLVSFLGWQAGFQKVYALDHDKACISLLQDVTRQQSSLTNCRSSTSVITPTQYSFGDDFPCSDVVVAGAIIHWVYSCTSAFGSLESIIEYLASHTKHVLIIEWVSPNDQAIREFKHLSFTKSCHKEPYDKEHFLLALSKHFTSVRKLQHPPPGPRRHPPPGPRRHPPPGPRRHPPPGPRQHPPLGPRRHPPPGPRRHPPLGPRQHPPLGPRQHPPLGPRQHPPPGPRRHSSPGPRRHSSPGPRRHSSPGPRRHSSPGPRRRFPPAPTRCLYVAEGPRANFLKWKMKQVYRGEGKHKISFCAPTCGNIGKTSNVLVNTTNLIHFCSGPAIQAKQIVAKQITRYREYDVFERELFWLQLFEEYQFSWAPKIYQKGRLNTWFTMSYVGEPITSENAPGDWRSQADSISHDLQSVHCNHNDVRRCEVLVHKGKLHLVDFGWASKGNDMSCGIGLSSKPKPHGIQNRSLLSVIQEALLSP